MLFLAHDTLPHTMSLLALFCVLLLHYAHFYSLPTLGPILVCVWKYVNFLKKEIFNFDVVKSFDFFTLCFVILKSYSRRSQSKCPTFLPLQVLSLFFFRVLPFTFIYLIHQVFPYIWSEVGVQLYFSPFESAFSMPSIKSPPYDLWGYLVVSILT